MNWKALGLLFLWFGLNPSIASALCVKSSRANLREGPGTRYSKTWEVYRYMPFRYLSRKGKWYKVKDVDGQKHWIHHSLVTKKHLCAVVKRPRVNLRRGPGKRYRVVGSAEQYFSLKVLKVRGKWVRTRDEYGSVGWIYRPLLWIN